MALQLRPRPTLLEATKCLHQRTAHRRTRFFRNGGATATGTSRTPCVAATVILLGAQAACLARIVVELISKEDVDDETVATSW